MGAILRYYGDKAVKKAIAEGFAWLVGVAEEAADKVKADLEKTSPPASKPGEPPKKRTSGFAEAVEVEASESAGVVRLGTNSKGLAAKEFGNSKEDPKPWMSAAIAYARDAAARDPRRFGNLQKRFKESRSV